MLDSRKQFKRPPKRYQPRGLSILYEDRDILVVDKVSGLLTVSSAKTRENTAYYLLNEYVRKGNAKSRLRVFVVHRLDKETSGLLVVAKSERSLRSLARQLKQREVHKCYLALVRGVPASREGVIDAPIGRHPRNRKKMATVAEGREATTRYRLRRQVGSYALLEVEPISGRTHQIRVHLASISHPIIGDAVYGLRSPYLSRQFLHAWRLRFLLESSKQMVELESPLPPDLSSALVALQGEVGEGDS